MYLHIASSADYVVYNITVSAVTYPLLHAETLSEC